ncbi:hypothetical protein GMORB2_1313 [Geosmithia morbida]|uniref:Uncharacterized protein n=1 Tax=Geosmithia morbida TaxID=1094350 RepID=A0A9P4Z277_9HYPO|nr:uncharacterized protein GMORB2_1313 [Geosmithia morbida]KAF4126067.1 hypothetical protein GMORB2_1313 [Geosmithia morbida]
MSLHPRQRRPPYPASLLSVSADHPQTAVSTRSLLPAITHEDAVASIQIIRLALAGDQYLLIRSLGVLLTSLGDPSGRHSIAVRHWSRRATSEMLRRFRGEVGRIIRRRMLMILGGRTRLEDERTRRLYDAYRWLLE